MEPETLKMRKKKKKRRKILPIKSSNGISMTHDDGSLKLFTTKRSDVSKIKLSNVTG